SDGSDQSCTYIVTVHFVGGACWRDCTGCGGEHRGSGDEPPGCAGNAGDVLAARGVEGDDEGVSPLIAGRSWCKAVGRVGVLRLRAQDDKAHSKLKWADNSVRPTRSSRAGMPAPHGLADFFAPVFQRLFHQGHELIGDGAVDDAVVVSEGEVDDGADSDGVG